MENDTEFLKRLLETFKIEAEEHLKGMSSGLLELEKNTDPEERAQLIETIFREAHSLKGAARAVNLTSIESLCQALETVFSSLKKGGIKTTTALFDLLQQAVDMLARILACPDEKAPGDRSLQRDLIRRLEGALKWGSGNAEIRETGEAVKREEKETKMAVGKSADNSNTFSDSLPPFQEEGQGGDGVDADISTNCQKETPPPPNLPLEGGEKIKTQNLASQLKPTGSETLRVSAAKLLSVLLQSEEMLSAKLAASQRAIELRAANASFAIWKKEWAKTAPVIQELRASNRHSLTRTNGISCNMESRDAIKPRSLEKLLDFIDWNNSFVETLEEQYSAGMKSADHDSRALGGMVNNLLEEMKKVMMFPFSSLLEILPKIVRDLARDNGKEADITIRGGEIEIDRRILEEIKDPLVHLVRNSIDHALEKPEERKSKNKPQCGMITVEVSPRDDKVEVVVADDGAGISLARIKAALLKAGMLSREKIDEMSDQELLPFIFQSGISTSPIITELSGRGLGLAIVREKVEKLGGTVSIETIPDAGTRFRILLPLTVATFRGILVRVGEQTFVIPSMYVEQTVRLKPEEIRTVENRETISLNGQAVSLARLADILELPLLKKAADSAGRIQAVILSAVGTRIAFLVNEVLGEQEVLQKGLGKQISRLRNVAGATVLGNGKVVPILNVADLMKSAMKLSAPVGIAPETISEKSDKHSVLVAEDSITTRTLLKNILETAGYDVVTAVDGLDAFTRLKSGAFDIVVSDIEMPRMSGFELTSKIRGDKELKELPVILVTALQSREDRERGIDAGASAYIVKSSFDQSNLLDVMRKLL